MTQAQLPAHLQTYQVPDLGATLSANLGSAMPPHVSIGGNRFTLIDASNNEIPVPTFDPKLGPYLDACIIDVADVMSRIYFAGNYDPSAEGVRPDCFSDNGVGPSVGASSPQAPTCDACPRSEWTKINANGKKVPWCSQKYKIALLIPGFDVVFLLAVPPNSHGPLREYVEKCKGNGAMMPNLITRISFISQGTLQFQPLSWIDDAVARLRQAAYAEKKTDALVGRNDVARPAGAMQVSQQPTQQIAAPVQQAPTPVREISPTWPQPAQQVQQPGPFVPTPAPNAAASGQWPPNPAPAAATTSPSEPLATGRRRRRTAAEIQAAQPTPGAQGAPHAPFPVSSAPGALPGQLAAFPSSPAASPGAAPGPQAQFGLAQPAAADPATQQMLDNFFKR